MAAPTEIDQALGLNRFRETVRRRVTKGIGANLVGQLLNVASKFLLVPVFITSWGPGLYGEWLILASAAGYLWLSELGAQLYIVNSLTQAYSQEQYAKFRVILHTGMAFFCWAWLVEQVAFHLGEWKSIMEIRQAERKNRAASR